jgi:hypothetical protein
MARPRFASALALVLLPLALASCDLIKRKVGGGSGATSLGFTASNVDLTGMDLSKVGDFKVEDPSCSLSSEDLLASCGNGGDVLAFKLAKQADGSPIAVYVARTVRIEKRAVLTITGKNPVAIIALDTIDIHGGLVAAATGEVGVAGGHTSAKKSAGAGGAGTTTTSAGGGGYCGKGGLGALEIGKAGAVAHGGAAYGSPSLVPLLGGGPGGVLTDPEGGGAGGGAIQLGARTSITIAVGASINVGGGGGEFGGETSGQGASGGGSGGAILLEAPAVTIAGTLAANGGGGGGGTSSHVPSGANGSASATAAAGGVSEGISPGGGGSAGAHIDGSNGSDTATRTAGGGGGGAGRIRINTATGVAAVTGATLSPAATTPCVTQGKLPGT